jgi:dephospho-CoA kinase
VAETGIGKRASGDRVVVLGVTGPIAGGKTAATDLLAARGAQVVELDRVGHELLGEEEVRAEIDAAFPEVAGVADPAELRARLGGIVFADAERLAALEGILHGRMCDRVRERVAERRRAAVPDMLVIVGALLLEMGLDEICDAVVVVDAPEDLRAQRAAESRGWDRGELRRREARQMPAEVKRGRADRVVDNSGSKQELEAEVAAIWEEYVCP